MPPPPRLPPKPLAGGPLAFLRFCASSTTCCAGATSPLITRWAWLKLRWRGRLVTDGLCFVCPGVKFEIGRDARVDARALVVARRRLQDPRA